MPRRARFRVMGRLDSAASIQEGFVTIDRGADVFSVRPLRRRRTYELPLSVVADLVVLKVVQAEKFKAKMAKAKERHATRRGRRR